MPSNSSALSIIAGPTAYKHLLENGLSQSDVKAIVAASGGPKWFILFGLDKYLFGNFFADRTEPLHSIGTSAGAWQMACFAQKDPVAAISRLAHYYSRETYSQQVDAREISSKARRMVDYTLGESGANEIASHPWLQTHILAARCHGLTRSENRWVQAAGLGGAAAANAVSRKLLRYFFERVVFHTGEESFFRLEDHPTRYSPLTAENCAKVLMATGSIPLVLEGVSDIPEAPQGLYRDGGIIDYHFDIPFLHDQHHEGLVIYPHFSQTVTPGWFDKSLRYRRVNPVHYDRVILLAPSPELIASLPYQKISDRNDFKLADEERLPYWQQVLTASESLAESLDECLKHGFREEQLKRFPAP